MILRRTILLGSMLSLTACGARSALLDKTPPPPPPLDVVRTDAVADVLRDSRPDSLPDAVAPTVTVACPAPIRSTQTLTVPLAGSASSNVGRPLTYQWELTRRPMDSMASLTAETTATASIRFDVGGEFRFRFTARDDLGNMASCETRADVESAIDLLCPNDQSNFQGATVPLEARARSRLMRPVTVRWEVQTRPAGSSANPTPIDNTSSRMVLDALGDWRLRLTARDSEGNTASCQTNLHADPDVIVMCPPDTNSRPFAMVNLMGQAQSRTMRPLTYRWEIVDRPITSTAMLRSPNTIASQFTFDVAGNWTYRFTATNDRGNSAFCTTRALSASEEAIRVEIVWNTDRSNPACDIANPGGNRCGDIDLHVANTALNMGRWGGTAPNNATCFYANCRCGMPGEICTDPMAIEWDPAGVINNPQLDVDHTDDLPGPENINIVRAAAGGSYDVGVHVFRLDESRTTPVVARVYCGGSVVFESEPVRLGPYRNSPDGSDLWIVGRITTQIGGCTFARCGSPGNLSACIRPQNAWGR
jgi:hypothetical protein